MTPDPPHVTQPSLSKPIDQDRGFRGAQSERLGKWDFVQSWVASVDLRVEMYLLSDALKTETLKLC